MKAPILAAFVVSLSTTVLGAPSRTATAAAIGPTQIRTDQNPVYHLYLQSVGRYTWITHGINALSYETE